MQRDQLRPRCGAELLAQQHAERRRRRARPRRCCRAGQHRDQRRAGGLAERRHGDRRAGGALRAAGARRSPSRPARPAPAPRSAAPRDRRAPREPRRVEVGQQARVGERRGDLRGVRVQPGAAAARSAIASTSTHTGSGNKPERVAALEHRGLDGAAQAREHGRQRGVARRRALVRPQRLDQLVAADRAAPVQHQVREREPPLAPAQLRLTALAGELHAELATEMDGTSGGRSSTPGLAGSLTAGNLPARPVTR